MTRSITASLPAGLKGICSFVFERDDDFQEILGFTSDMSKQYNMHVHKLQSDFKTGVEGLLETTKLQAIILGTRRYFRHEARTASTISHAVSHQHSKHLRIEFGHMQHLYKCGLTSEA